VPDLEVEYLKVCEKWIDDVHTMLAILKRDAPDVAIRRVRIMLVYQLMQTTLLGAKLLQATEYRIPPANEKAQEKAPKEVPAGEKA